MIGKHVHVVFGDLLSVAAAWVSMASGMLRQLRRLALRPALWVIWATLIPASAFAQGAIGGTVRDSSGAVLPGVTVEAASPALIERVRAAVTDDRGQYLIVDLRPGAYTVTFALSGFSTLKREGLAVSAGVTLPVNAELAVGSLAENITVSGESPVVDVQNARRQSTVGDEVLESIPRSHNGALIGALLPGVTPNTRDVGGSAGEAAAGGQLVIHGGDRLDQVWTIDGMWVHDVTSSGQTNSASPSEVAVQEYTYEVSSAPAETNTGGVHINVVLKDGGNDFRGMFAGDVTTSKMATSRLSETLRTKWGLERNDQIDKLWNTNPAFGGPILRNRLWFFSAYHAWGSARFPVDAYYESDPTRPARYSENLWALSTRVTHQATPRNKFTFYVDDHGRYVPYAGVNNLRSPEAATRQESPKLYLVQIKWTSPVTNRLLLEAGYSHSNQTYKFSPSPASRAGAYPIQELTTNKITGATTSGRTLLDSPLSHYIGSAAYITGSHAVKVGVQLSRAHRWQFNQDFPPTVRTSNRVPVQVQLSAVPGESLPSLNYDLGLFAQDQWRIHRFTVNLGARFDALKESIEEQNEPASRYIPVARHYDSIKDVPNWKDFNPRLGIVYDVFGDGKTAVKATLNRYVANDVVAFARSVNPVTAGAQNFAMDLRTVVSTNGSVDPTEWTLGPSTNANFGSPVLAVRPDEAIRKGWGVRLYNWEYAASVQHEVVPGMSVMAGYYRRSYGNLTWTNNTLVQLGDYQPFTIRSPLDGEIVTLYNLDPAKRGLSSNVVQLAPDDARVFDGLDLLLNGKFGRGGFVGGGVSTGRTKASTCTTSDPNTLRFCKVSPPFMALNQYKIMAGYPLPYGLQLSTVFQSYPGPQIAALYTVTSAIAGIPLTNGTIAPAQPATSGGGAGVPLISPTSFGERSNELDLRLMKTVRTGSIRVRPDISVYNIFNSTPVIALNTTYGPNWQRPTTILTGRILKVGMQVDF